MAKYALISDIHGNEIALDAVLAEIDASEGSDAEIDEILCLGDVVGYGPRPVECIRKIRERKIPWIIGNHDKVTGESSRDIFNLREDAIAALKWTYKQVSDKDKRYIRKLGFSMTRPGFTIAHTVPLKPEELDYILGPDDAFDKVFSELGKMKSRDLKNLEVCFIGHTHSPACYSMAKKVGLAKDNAHGNHAYGDLKITLDSDFYYVVNCGSVGQSRDDDARACYVTYDSDNRELKFHRVEYNIERVRVQLAQTDLPEDVSRGLAQRLEGAR